MIWIFLNNNIIDLCYTTSQGDMQGWTYLKQQQHQKENCTPQEKKKMQWHQLPDCKKWKEIFHVWNIIMECQNVYDSTWFITSSDLKKMVMYHVAKTRPSLRPHPRWTVTVRIVKGSTERRWSFSKCKKTNIVNLEQHRKPAFNCGCFLGMGHYILSTGIHHWCSLLFISWIWIWIWTKQYMPVESTAWFW